MPHAESSRTILSLTVMTRTQTVTRCDTTAGIDHVAATVGTSERSARP